MLSDTGSVSGSALERPRARNSDQSLSRYRGLRNTRAQNLGPITTDGCLSREEDEARL